MPIIRLPNGSWQYDDTQLLGQEGGFGAVYAGQSEKYGDIAVKMLHITASDAAHRELAMAEILSQRDMKHVMPVFDAGQDAESERYFVVMPRATKSLSDHIEQKSAVGQGETVSILLAIAEGLAEVSDITHRDLKPANILYHDNRWKVADFGIARFVEESTSERTLKHCHSPHYAAPEQWKQERATSATDIYALGCIAYSLLTGEPPFDGDTQALHDKHLQKKPPPLGDVDALLSSLVSMMLRKSPQARHSLDRVINILRRIEDGVGTAQSEGASALAQASAEVAHRQAGEEAISAAKRRRAERRAELASTGIEILRELIETLFDTIRDNAPAVQAQVDQPGAFRRGRNILFQKVRIVDDIRLGNGQIGFRFVDDWTAGVTTDERGWDAVLQARIEVIQLEPRYEVSSSLFFARRPEQDCYRWIEMAFRAHVLSSRRPQFQPFAVDDWSKVMEALSSTHGATELAYGPRDVDNEDLAQFVDRWQAKLALAANGKLHL